MPDPHTSCPIEITPEMFRQWATKRDSLPRTLQRILSRLVDGDYVYWWKRGIRNIFRYTPVIWRDDDFDWEGLVTIMAFKFERMAEVHKTGHLMRSGTSEKQLRIAANCCRRLLADKYDEQAGYEWGTISGRVDARHVFIRGEWAARSDERILGKLISKHLRTWWD